MTRLQLAKDRKDDEFYTRFDDIEKYSVRNYFTKVLLNYDPSKISFIKF